LALFNFNFYYGTYNNGNCVFEDSRTVIRPLNDIISVSKEITNGNYSRRIKLKSKDEAGTAAVHFNKMASKLERTISDLNTKKIEP